MKRLFLLLVLLLTTTTLFAQEVEPPALDVSFSAMASFFVKAILAQVTVMVIEARKWIGSGNWSWSEFFGTNIGPFLWSLGGGVVIYLALAYMPWFENILEAFLGEELTEYTGASFMAFGMLLFKFIIKPTKTDADS